MNRAKVDRPGPIIFLSGVVLVIVSTALGLYLAALPVREFPGPDWHYPDYESLGEIRGRAIAQASLVSNVHALMWLTFGLGVTLTLVGLRMMIHPPIDLASTSTIKSCLDISEV